MFSKRDWLARLSFSFFIIAIVLAWESYKIIEGLRPPVPIWQLILYLIGAAAGFALGFLGVRERHRPRD